MRSGDKANVAIDASLSLQATLVEEFFPEDGPTERRYWKAVMDNSQQPVHIQGPGPRWLVTTFGIAPVKRSQ